VTTEAENLRALIERKQEEERQLQAQLDMHKQQRQEERAEKTREIQEKEREIEEKRRELDEYREKLETFKKEEERRQREDFELHRREWKPEHQRGFQKKLQQHLKENPNGALSTLLASSLALSSSSLPPQAGDHSTVAYVTNSIGFVSSVLSPIKTKISGLIYGQAWTGKHVIAAPFEILDR
jgi:hypothetical protein